MADFYRQHLTYPPVVSIHVGAAVRPQDLETLKAQLKVGGRLIVPVGVYEQELMRVGWEGHGRSKLASYF